MRIKKLVKLLVTMPLMMFGICGVEGGEPSPSPEDSVDSLAAGDSTPERTFTQAEVNRMMKAEKESGRASVLKELGVKDFKTAKEGLEQYRISIENNKTDLQKANDAAALANQEKADALSRAAKAEACLAAVKAGAQNAYVDDLVAIAISKVTEENDLNSVLEDMKKNPAYVGFFTKDNDSSSSGTGKLPSPKKPSTQQGSYGERLAKLHQNTITRN